MVDQTSESLDHWVWLVPSFTGRPPNPHPDVGRDTTPGVPSDRPGPQVEVHVGPPGTPGKFGFYLSHHNPTFCS